MDHVHHALQQHSQAPVSNGLEDIRLVHPSLPDTQWESVSLHTSIGELQWSSPIFINAMTGGAEDTARINRSLAEAAAEAGIAMAVGSQMAAIRDPALRDTFKVARDANPHGFLFANLGGEATVDQAMRAIDMIEANALQIHLNVMQELIMPEGDRDFQGAWKRIEKIIQKVGVPVTVKEVGFGMSRETALQLQSIGAYAIDIGGKGGTNFASIENRRRDISMDMLNDWGISTSCSLLEVHQAVSPLPVIASGGIKDGWDAVKCLTIGASAVGFAGPALKSWAHGGTEGVVEFLQQVKEQIRTVMTALGATTIPELGSVSTVILGETAEWCRQRGIDTTLYARRGPTLV
jgi:isopentenyl-diphosphate delta-isomerase